MRRLPVFFVLDCSESMAGDKIAKMESGLQSIVRNLRTDPHALETVHVSVLAFAGVAKFPARVKCALLPWMAFKDAAARAGVEVSA